MIIVDYKDESSLETSGLLTPAPSSVGGTAITVTDPRDDSTEEDNQDKTDVKKDEDTSVIKVETAIDTPIVYTEADKSLEGIILPDFKSTD